MLSKSAEEAGLAMSLFERLELSNHPVVMLNIQYRMSPGTYIIVIIIIIIIIIVIIV